MSQIIDQWSQNIVKLHEKLHKFIGFNPVQFLNNFMAFVNFLAFELNSQLIVQLLSRMFKKQGVTKIHESIEIEFEGM